MIAGVVPLKFQIGARTLAAIPRRLVRVALSLDDVLADRTPPFPPLGPDDDGYIVTSLPSDRCLAPQPGGLLPCVRQQYVRYHVDLTVGAEAWRAQLSANARATLRRKNRKLAAASGGVPDIRRYRSPTELAEFYPLARRVSALTYQEKLLGSGLPDEGIAMDHLYALAAADSVRAWLLVVGATPIAYLCCTAQGTVLRYDYVGHDPAFADLSPGALLQERALHDLFADRFARFDFTEGQGQHKRQLATGGTACSDLLLLRPTLPNRLAVSVLGAFDCAAALAKRLGQRPSLARLAKRVRR